MAPVYSVVHDSDSRPRGHMGRQACDRSSIYTTCNRIDGVYCRQHLQAATKFASDMGMTMSDLLGHTGLVDSILSYHFAPGITLTKGTAAEMVTDRPMLIATGVCGGGVGCGPAAPTCIMAATTRSLCSAQHGRVCAQLDAMKTHCCSARVTLLRTFVYMRTAPQRSWTTTCPLSSTPTAPS